MAVLIQNKSRITKFEKVSFWYTLHFLFEK